MALIDEVKKLQDIFDYLYWTDSLNDYRKQIYKNIRYVNYNSIPEKHAAFSKAATELLSGQNMDYNKLLEKAQKAIDEDKFSKEYFASIISKQPELKGIIEKSLDNIIKAYPQEEMFVKRLEAYNNLKKLIFPKLKKEITISPQDKEEMKKNLQNILAVFNSILNKLTLSQQKKLHDIEGKYLNTKDFVSDEHIDELLGLYDNLPLPPLDIMIAKVKRKKEPIPLNAQEEHLNIEKSLSQEALKALINNINYVQKLIYKKISFGEKGKSSEQELLTKLGETDEITSKLVLTYLKNFENLTGQKIILE